MLSYNDKASLRQIQILLVLDIFGTGIQVLPRRAAEYAGQDGWIAIIGATLLALFCVLIMTTLAKKFPDDSFFSYSSKIIGRPIAILISAGFVLKIFFSLALELRLFGEIIKEIMLGETPYLVVFLGIAGVAAFAASKGFETRARMGEILIYLVLIPFTILIAFGLFEVDFTNLLPVMTSDPQDIARGSLWSGISFTGLEFVLFLYPYSANKKDLQKSLLHATMLIGFLMLFITIVALARFGPFRILHQMWPVLEMLKMIRLPGAFVERQDAFVMTFWIISVFSITGAGLFFSSLLTKDIIGKGKPSIYILASLPVIYILSRFPKDISMVYELQGKLFITMGIAYLFIIPFFLLIVANLRRLGEKS